MSVQFRNNVHVAGSGPATIVFAHGFGCDQTMWRYLAPAFSGRFRTVIFDLTGCGASDLSAYDRKRHATLHGHAEDLLDIVDACATGPVVFVGHSVSAMIGMLATISAPERFAAQVMVGPSPCYVNDGDYVGGFNRDELDELLDTMENDFFRWSLRMAPAIMGAPDKPVLRDELTASFLRTDPTVARHFARITFLSDHRADLERSTVPALVLQCSDDMLVPREVGHYLQGKLPNSTLHVIGNVGHCPHLSAPDACTRIIEAFLDQHLEFRDVDVRSRSRSGSVAE